MEWISVKDKMPTYGEYLVYIKDKRADTSAIVVALYLEDADKWKLSQAFPILGDITHWMPLPAPPESRENDV